MEEEYQDKVSDERKWVCKLCRGLTAYGSRFSAHINKHLIREHKKTPPHTKQDKSTATMSGLTPQQSVLELQRHAPRIVEERLDLSERRAQYYQG